MDWGRMKTFFYFAEKWFPIDELDVAELSTSKKFNSVKCFTIFFPCFAGRKTRKWSIMFWSICGHFKFLHSPISQLPLRNNFYHFTYIRTTKWKINPTIWCRWSEWFFMLQSFNRIWKLFFNLLWGNNITTSLTYEYTRLWTQKNSNKLSMILWFHSSTQLMPPLGSSAYWSLWVNIKLTLDGCLNEKYSGLMGFKWKL